MARRAEKQKNKAEIEKQLKIYFFLKVPTLVFQSLLEVLNIELIKFNFYFVYFQKISPRGDKSQLKIEAW